MSELRAAASTLSDVPEEGSESPASRSPYIQHTASASTSTLPFGNNGVPRSPNGNAPSSRSPVPTPAAAPPRRTSSRNPSTVTDRSAATATAAASTTQNARHLSEQPSATSLRHRASDSTVASVKDSSSSRRGAGGSTPASSSRRARDDADGESKEPKVRTVPRLPHDREAKPAPATVMYWSTLPVHGVLPNRGMRAHTVNLVDSIAWVFGGCDAKGCWKDVWCFDTETFQWSHPEMLGDIPPPCRAHTTTLVDRKLVVYGGGQGPAYYHDVYVLDTISRRWSHAVFPADAPAPPSRRAHTAVPYRGKIWVFGGGNGQEALNDVWTLDVGQTASVDRMRWEQIDTKGTPPSPRGYHTASLIGNVMVIVGGSDGRECFADIWCFNLDTLTWTQIKPDVSHRRLSHTATQVGSYLFILGGHDGANYTSELLLFNLVSLQYEPRQVLGKRPSPRGYHVALLADSRLIAMGGFNGHDVFEDVYALELAAAAYLPQVTSFTIEGV